MQLLKCRLVQDTGRGLSQVGQAVEVSAAHAEVFSGVAVAIARGDQLWDSIGANASELGRRFWGVWRG